MNTVDPVVAVIDSGVQHRHPHLRHVNVRHLVLDGSVVTATADGGDVHGHGTAVAAAIVSHVCRGELLSLRVLDADLDGRLSSVLRAIELAWRAGASLINLSLGSPSSEAGFLFAAAVEQAARHGAAVVAAADSSARWPSDLASVLSAEADATCPPDGLRPRRISALQPDGHHRRLWRFGAFPGARQPSSAVPPGNLAGSSLAAAHLTGLAWSVLSEDPCVSVHTLANELARRWADQQTAEGE